MYMKRGGRQSQSEYFEEELDILPCWKLNDNLSNVQSIA